MVNATVYVQYDPATSTVTLTGGTEQANDGSVTCDPGTNTITFTGKDQDTSVWTMKDVTLTNPANIPDPSTFTPRVTPTEITLIDEDRNPGRAAVTWDYVLTVNDLKKRVTRKADPVVINRPAPPTMRRMSGNA
jgi:hypothetical protein